MNKKKIELINKLQDLDAKKQEMRANPAAAQEAQAGAPPSADEVDISVLANIEAKNIDLHIRLEKPGWIIRSVILYSDTLFTGGSLAVHP